MTLEEARKKIEQEFMNKYYEFLKDVTELNDKDFGRKYGVTLSEEGKKKYSKDSQASVISFQKNIFCGRYLPHWIEVGFEKHTIWQLHKIGFLSYQWIYNSNAIAMGRTDFYYISQATAKEIYKAYKR
jgi:hypothetical protein